MSVQILAQDQAIFTLDLALADIKTHPAASSAQAVSGDSFSVKFPGVPPSANVAITSGASEVAFTIGSTVLTCTVSTAKAALINKGQGQSITVVRTPSAGQPIGFEFSGQLNVKSEANP